MKTRGDRGDTEATGRHPRRTNGGTASANRPAKTYLVDGGGNLHGKAQALEKATFARFSSFAPWGGIAVGLLVIFSLIGRVPERSRARLKE